ncbi:hypothetical protein [Mycolicibacterium pulveris]|uniref:hypothetical protein n=1 Tax=Mycolicibacterium pulveris TaxID=36813 RepID=UPI003CF2E8D4
MIYGYRLWAVDLHLGRKQHRHEFGAALIPIEEVDETGNRRSSGDRTVNYIDLATADANNHLGITFSFGKARGAEDDESGTESRGFSMRFRSADPSGTNLHLKFEHGLRHADGLLIDPDDPAAPDVHLKNKSTLHPYRATLVVKPELRRGLLVVEARGRSCPMVSIVRGLNEINSEGLRLRVIAHLADEAAFLDYIRNAEVRQVNFDRWAYDDDGARDRREVSMGVMTHIETRTVLEAAAQWCKDYFGLQKRFNADEGDVSVANELDLSNLTPAEQRAARAQLKSDARKAKVEARAKRDRARRSTAEAEAAKLRQSVFANRKEDVSIDFTDVSIDLFNDGAAKRIGPTSDFRRLTYGISETLPSDDRFWEAAEATASSLLGEVQDLPLE